MDDSPQTEPSSPPDTWDPLEEFITFEMRFPKIDNDIGINTADWLEEK